LSGGNGAFAPTMDFLKKWPGWFERHFLNYHKFIEVEAGKRGGKPCVRGLRITVGDVLGWLAAGMSHQEIVNDFPDLTDEDIRACLAFAAARERGTA